MYYHCECQKGKQCIITVDVRKGKGCVIAMNVKRERDVLSI